jgi:O-antigen ligase
MLIRATVLLLVTLLALATTGKDIYLLGLVPALLLGWLAIELLGAYRQKIIFDPALFSLMSLMSGWWLLSTLWSVTPSASLVTIYLPIIFYSSYLLATIWAGRATEFYGRLDLLLILAISLSAIYAIYQQLVSESPSSLMANKNNHAALLNLGIFFIYTRVLQHRFNKTGLLYTLALLLMTTAMFTVGSRGAMISYAVGLLFVTVVLNRRLCREYGIVLLVVPILAFYLASVIGENYVVSRAATLADMAGGVGLQDRLDIWRDSLVLIQQRLFMGHGVGTFWMLFPMVRNPLQTPFYFFAHNDYLQMWIELGLVGLLLFLALLSYAAARVYQLLNSNELPKDRFIMAVATTAGLLTLLIHSAVTFNLNLPIFLLLLGISIARLQNLYVTVNGGKRTTCFTITPETFMTRRGYSLIVIAGFLLSANFSISFFTSSILLNLAKSEIIQGNVESGSRKLGFSRTISPDVDIFHMERANILRKSLHRYWEERVFERSVEGYNRCIEANRYRVECYSGLADILNMHPDRGRYFSQVEPLYQQALSYDPASPVVLANYAIHYIRQANPQKALQTLQGTEKFLMERRAGEEFYLLTYIQLLKQLGKEDVGGELSKRLNQIVEVRKGGK